MKNGIEQGIDRGLSYAPYSDLIWMYLRDELDLHAVPGLRRYIQCHTIPGGYGDAVSMLRKLDYPSWNVQVNVSYNLFGSQADAQFARARVQRTMAAVTARAWSG